MFLTTYLHRLLITLSIVISFGVLVHDTKFDQAATIALAIPLGMTLSLGHAIELKGEAHTHVERVAFDKAARVVNGIPPRTDTRKYLLTKHARGFNMPEPHTLLVTPALA